MQINFFADKKNLLLLIDWINKKYNNPIKFDQKKNKLSNGELLGPVYVIFKDVCEPTEYEKYVQEKVEKNLIGKSELEIWITPSDEALYELDDPTNYLLYPYKKDSTRASYFIMPSRIYLCSWYSDEKDFQIKKKHYNEIKRFIIKNSIIYRIVAENGHTYVEYVLKLD